MSKKPILSKHPKKILALILVCLITITLTGCDTSNRKPTGDINLDATYASIGNKYSVTVEDVYEKLRYNAVSYIENSVYNFLYQEEISTVEADLKSENPKYAEKIEHEILHDIYDVHEEDEIDDLTDKQVETAILTYIDEMYQKGYVITKEQIRAKEFASVYSNYYLEVAKYIAAKNELSKEFTVAEDGTIDFGNITEDSYFSTDEVVAWYENNYTNVEDVTAILIRFINNEEANSILKKFGLKSSGGKWYQIKLDPEKEDEWKTKNGYDKYYDNYKINTSDETTIISIDEYGNGNATVLKVFAEIYNYVYTYRNPIVFEKPTVEAEYNHLQYYSQIKAILDADFETAKNPNNTEYETLLSVLEQYEESNNETIVMSKEKLNKYSSTLASYLYNNLATEAEEEGKSFTQYITTAKSLGNYYYLLYKIDQVADEVLYEEVGEDDEKEINFTNETLLNTILNEMFEDALNDTYVENQFTNRVKEAKLEIYDSIVESLFMYTSSSVLAESYEKNKEINNNLIAEVTYKDKSKEISTSDVYSYLEPLYGTQVATNLLFKQYIKDTPYYSDLADDYDNYVETVKLMLYYFANDYYASSGYPSTIGKYNFMMLYYGTANVDEVVKDFLMVSDATSAFFAENAHGDEFYSNILDYSLQTYNDFYSLTASGLTVYVDRDEDGKADELDAVEDADLIESAQNLLNLAYTQVINSHVAYESALNNVVADYNSSSRISSENPTSPEAKWAEYRSEGLYLEVSSFGTFTNTTETKETEINDRIAELYNVVVDSKLGFTSQYLDSETLTTSDNKYTKLLITAGTTRTSAKYEAALDEEAKLYENINVIINDKKVTINLDYTSDLITIEQVKVYVAEYLLLGDVYSLPSTTISALDAYVLPVISKYTGSASQTTITYNELSKIGEINFGYNGPLSNQFSPEFKENYTRASFYENYIKVSQNAEDSYDEVYTDWWNTMYQGGSN